MFAFFFPSCTMPFLDDEIKRLQSVVDRLEGRVKNLETRQFGGSVSTEAIRMILIGPPGAGKQVECTGEVRRCQS